MPRVPSFRPTFEDKFKRRTIWKARQVLAQEKGIVSQDITTECQRSIILPLNDDWYFFCAKASGSTGTVLSIEWPKYPNKTAYTCNKMLNKYYAIGSRYKPSSSAKPHLISLAKPLRGIKDWWGWPFSNFHRGFHNTMAWYGSKWLINDGSVESKPSKPSLRNAIAAYPASKWPGIWWLRLKICPSPNLWDRCKSPSHSNVVTFIGMNPKFPDTPGSDCPLLIPRFALWYYVLCPHDKICSIIFACPNSLSIPQCSCPSLPIHPEACFWLIAGDSCSAAGWKAGEASTGFFMLGDSWKGGL